MKKLLSICLIGLMACFVVAALVVGCGTVASSGGSTLTDPGRITSPEVTVSLNPSYASGAVTLNLSSIIVSDEAIDLTEGMFKVFAGTNPGALTSWDSITFTFIDTTSEHTPVDVAFILDNTGSMASRINTVKNSISVFAATLEAADLDVRFAGCAFGDYSTEKATMGAYSKEFAAIDFDTTTATSTASSVITTSVTTSGALAEWLDSFSLYSGHDGAENPLDSVMYAYNNFAWRAGAQKVFIVVTDIYCHQTNWTGDSTCDYVNYPNGI